MGDCILTLFLVSLSALMWEGDGRKVGLVERVENCVLSLSRRGGGVIVEGISAANKIIQREELVESSLQEKRATGERAAARQCLPPGEGERPAAATGFWQAQPALERMPRRMRTWGLEKDAEL